MRYLGIILTSIAAGSVMLGSAYAGDYTWKPDKPISIIVPWSAGGSTDQVTRARMLFERCWDGEMAFIGVDHQQPLPVRAVYEWAALTKALINTGC